MSSHPCDSPSLQSRDTGGRLPGAVATAWEVEVGRNLAEADGATPVPVPAAKPAVLELAPLTAAQRVGDYALLAVAGAAALTLLTVVVTHARWQSDIPLVLAASLAGVALVAAHLLLLTRRRTRAAEQAAARAQVELALRARVADTEARHLRLAAFSELAAQIAHEVRNPLSAIVLNAELLEDELHACIHASPEVKRLARAVSAEAERLTELTNEYLTFARLPRPSTTSQRLAPLLEEVVRFTRGEVERCGVTLALELDPAVAAVVDAKLVRQVLLNLIRNAIDAMPGGGRLTLRTSAEKGRVRIDVIDDGPGIPPGLHASAFEPFFSTKPHGTGLGLAVARKVARDHGGDLRIVPTPRGAWLRFDLPSAPAVAAAAVGVPAEV